MAVTLLLEQINDAHIRENFRKIMNEFAVKSSDLNMGGYDVLNAGNLVLTDGSSELTGDLDMGGFNIVNIGSSAHDLVDHIEDLTIHQTAIGGNAQTQ